MIQEIVTVENLINVPTNFEDSPNCIDLIISNKKHLERSADFAPVLSDYNLATNKNRGRNSVF